MVSGENGGPGIPETVFHPKDARKPEVGLATNLHLQMVESHAWETIYKLQASFSVLDMVSYIFKLILIDLETFLH